MTKKRFVEQNLENHLNKIYDNQKGKVVFDEDICDLLNALHEENKELKMDKDSLATGFDEYQVQVAETLQKHYNQTLNTHIARFVKLLADELGIDLQ